MAHLRIKELAEARGLNLTTVQRETKIPVSTVRRYWYSSRTGRSCDAGTLREVNLKALSTIATLLDVRPGDLLSENHEEGAADVCGRAGV